MDERRSLLSARRHDAEHRPGNACKVKVAQGAILLTVALERLAFYSLTGNLVLFLNSGPFNWRSYNALYCTFVFLGISYVLSFVGGIIADTLLGKFKTLLLSFVIYLVGYVFLPVITKGVEFISPNITALPDICGGDDNDDDGSDMYEIMVSQESGKLELIDENCAGLIFGILTIIAVGSGIFRSVVAPFGADQVKFSSLISFKTAWFFCACVKSKHLKGALAAKLMFCGLLDNDNNSFTVLKNHQTLKFMHLTIFWCK